MNWILSILFYFVIFSCYKIIGKCFGTLLNLGNDTYSSFKDIFTGFIILYFIGFIVGFPCQYFHLSWNIFKYTYLLILIFLVGYSLYLEKEFFKKYIKRLKKLIYIHIKENWIIYLMVFIFVFFAITNVLVYYQNNYDDAYYLGKIVNQIGAKQLSTENFFNGSISYSSLYRIINTYEISYGLFSDIFHISVPFFCRVTMAAHNYFMLFSLYKLLAEYFVKKEVSQFCLLPFIFLLISAGYAMEGNMPVSINMFDGWQFQTAIFYGSSVVRTMAIPAIIIYCEKLIKKFELKNIIFMGILYVVFMSFSTIFLIYAIIVTIILFFSKGIISLKTDIAIDKKINIKNILCIFIPVLLLILSKFLDKISMIATENYFNNLSQYIDFSNWYFYGDTFIYYALAIFVCSYFVFKNTFCQFTSIVIISLFLMIFTKLFYELIIISSGFFWFVALRFTTSVQFMLVFFIGCLFVYFLQRISFRKMLLSLSSVLCMFATVLYIFYNIDDIKKQNWLASGMTEYGYSINSIKKNDEMMPNIMCDVGEYFNEKEYGNYSLLLPATINWDGFPLSTNGFIFASNRIELCIENGAKNLSQDDLQALYDFLSNNKNYNEIENILFEHEIRYILVQDINQKDALIKNGWTLERSSDKINETYYLLKYS